VTRNPSEKTSIGDQLLRFLLTIAHRLLRLNWFVRRPRTFGAHALALTPERKLVMVKVRYATGWRLPGGGQNPGESAQQAVLRELREEIGLTAHGQVRLACELEQSVDHKRDLASLLVIEDVTYSPRRWSLEIERVEEFELDALPQDVSLVSRRWIEAILPHI
jgi:8-oxo-dGTP pyrophosphatase MutT (NUDIX family)